MRVSAAPTPTSPHDRLVADRLLHARDAAAHAWAATGTRWDVDPTNPYWLGQAVRTIAASRALVDAASGAAALDTVSTFDAAPIAQRLDAANQLLRDAVAGPGVADAALLVRAHREIARAVALLDPLLAARGFTGLPHVA